MALVLANRVRETSTTTGTGTITLAGAVTGYQTFSAGIGANNTCYYTISNPGVAEWEVGLGTVGSPATTLARTTILASSNAGSAVNFSAGTKDVFVTYPSSKSVYLHASGNASALGTPASGTVTNLTGTASININGTVGATTPNTGAFTTISGSGALTITDTTQSTSTSTGSIITSGGVGIAKALQVGGAGTFGGNLTVLQQVQSASATDLVLNANGANRDIIGKINGVEGFRYVGSTTNFSVTGTLSSTGAATLSNGATISATSGALGIKLIGRAADNVSNLLFYKNDGTTLVGDITNTNSAINVEVGSVVGSFTSTGVAVTGTLSATGLITKTNSAATQSQFLAVSGSTTAATYADITNTTGALRIGIESSAGGILATGTSAYASVVSSNSATALQLCGGGIIGVSIASTGITTIPKRLVVTGSDNATLASFTNSNNSGNVVGDFINSAATSTNQYGVRATLSGDPNSTGTYFFNCLGNITERGTWRGNGGIANYQANDVNLSDMSIKTDFHAYDSNMIWDFGKRMKGAWGRFKYDDQTHDDWNNGYGAQLVRDAAGSDFPELVEETDWRGKGNVLTVYDSDLMHIMGAVTTEAQHRIEEQEARIARLEAALANAGISLQ